MKNKTFLSFLLGFMVATLIFLGLGLKGNYTKEIAFDNDIQWRTDDSDNTIEARCGNDRGEKVQGTDVISAMPAFGTFSTKVQVIKSWYKEAAKLSLGLTDDDFE